MARAWFTTEQGVLTLHLDEAGDGTRVEVRPATEKDKQRFPRQYAQSQGIPDRDPRLDLEWKHGE